MRRREGKDSQQSFKGRSVDDMTTSYEALKDNYDKMLYSSLLYCTCRISGNNLVDLLRWNHHVDPSWDDTLY